MQVLAVDPGQREVSEGVPLMSGAPFLLQHCATKQVCMLCATGVIACICLCALKELHGYVKFALSQICTVCVI